jgi:hypothetical protein
MYSCMKMEKWALVEIILGMGGEIKENDKGNEFNYDILWTFVNVTMYSQYNNNMVIKVFYKGTTTTKRK